MPTAQIPEVFDFVFEGDARYRRPSLLHRQGEARVVVIRAWGDPHVDRERAAFAAPLRTCLGEAQPPEQLKLEL